MTDPTTLRAEAIATLGGVEKAREFVKLMASGQLVAPSRQTDALAELAELSINAPADEWAERLRQVEQERDAAVKRAEAAERIKAIARAAAAPAEREGDGVLREMLAGLEADSADGRSGEAAHARIRLALIELCRRALREDRR